MCSLGKASRSHASSLGGQFVEMALRFAAPCVSSLVADACRPSSLGDGGARHVQTRTFGIVLGKQGIQGRDAKHGCKLHRHGV